LRPDNRHAVLNALPFIVRLGGQFDTSVRRKMYGLLTAGGTASERRLLSAALKDPDAVIRARAVRSVVTAPGFEDKAEILERFAGRRGRRGGNLDSTAALCKPPSTKSRGQCLPWARCCLSEDGLKVHVLLDRSVRR
jgi:hypothetical protein